MEIKFILFLLPLYFSQTLKTLKESYPTTDKLGYLWNDAKGTGLHIPPIKTYQTMTQYPNGTIVGKYGLNNPGPNFYVHVENNLT
jgi:hypothetical protein